MNLFYLNKSYSFGYDLFDDSSAFYCLFLMAEKLSFSSNHSFLVSKYLEKVKWDEKELIDLFYFIVDDSEHFWTREEAEENFKIARKIRNRQVTGQGLAKMLMVINHNKDVMRDYIRQEIETFFEEGDFDLAWISLFENKFIKTEVFYVPKLHSENVETELTTMIMDKIIIGDEVFFFPINIHFDKKMFYLEETVYDSAENYEIYSMPLFKLLYSSEIAKVNMPILRNNILTIVSPLMEKLQQFRTSISSEIYSHSIHDKIVEFYESLKPLRESIQKKLNDQMYFQQIKNSTDDSRELEIRASVSSLDLIIDYFSTSDILLPFIATAMKQNLSLQKDLDKCEMFLDFMFLD